MGATIPLVENDEVITCAYGCGGTKMFENKCEAFQCIARGMKEGLFKNCVHLDVGGGSNGFTFYHIPSALQRRHAGALQ